MKKGGGIGITMRAYEKKGQLVVQTGNVAAIAGRIPQIAPPQKHPTVKLPRNLTRQKYVNKRGKLIYYYFAQFLDREGNNRKVPLGTNYKVARDQLLDVLAEHQRRRPPHGRSSTFADWAATYLSLVSSKSSADRDRQMVEHLKRFFGQMALSDITGTKILHYKNTRLASGLMRWGKQIEKKVKLSTVNRELSCLRAMLHLAVGERLLNRDELPRIRLESEERFARDRVLKDEEYMEYLAACPKWFKRISVGAYETGMARKDLISLTWDRIDRQAGVIRGNRLKTGVRQITPITKGLRRCLDEIAKDKPTDRSPGSLVFTTDGEPITYIMVRHAFAKVVKKARIFDFKFHDFRHTAKTRWHHHGITPEIAMLATGQKSLRTHYRYVNLSDRDIAAAFKNL